MRDHTCFYFYGHPRELEVEILGQPNNGKFTKEFHSKNNNKNKD